MATGSALALKPSCPGKWPSCWSCFGPTTLLLPRPRHRSACSTTTATADRSAALHHKTARAHYHLIALFSRIQDRQPPLKATAMAPVHSPPLCALRRARAVALSNPAHNAPESTDSTTTPKLDIALPETTHLTHTAYLATISALPDLTLSALTAAFHWRAHALLRRVILFHWDAFLLARITTTTTHNNNTNEKKDMGPLTAAAAGKKFLESGAASTSTIPVTGAQLLALKQVVRALTAVRVLETLRWIEDHDVARVAVVLEARALGARQRWCAGCSGVFYRVGGSEERQAPLMEQPMGVTSCKHILCRDCILWWLNDGEARGRQGKQPCCC